MGEAWPGFSFNMLKSEHVGKNTYWCQDACLRSPVARWSISNEALVTAQLSAIVFYLVFCLYLENCGPWNWELA